MIEAYSEKFNLAIKDVSDVEDSNSSTVYKCRLINGETVFLKIPYTPLKWQRELEAYEVLNGHVSTPKLLNSWQGDDKLAPALLLSALEGSPLCKNVTENVVYQVGVLQATMHNVKPPTNYKYKGIQNEFPNWSAFIEKQFYHFAKDVQLVLDEKLYNKAIAKYERMKRNLPPNDGPSFVHMDFRPANIIVSGDYVSGVIDFESVRFGSTEIDFIKIHRDLLRHDEKLFSAFQEGYKSIRPLVDLQTVLPFYSFTDSFNGIGWCKRRGIEQNEAFLKESIERLKSWL